MGICPPDHGPLIYLPPTLKGMARMLCRLDTKSGKHTVSLCMLTCCHRQLSSTCYKQLGSPLSASKDLVQLHLLTVICFTSSLETRVCHKFAMNSCSQLNISLHLTKTQPTSYPSGMPAASNLSLCSLQQSINIACPIHSCKHVHTTGFQS